MILVQAVPSAHTIMDATEICAYSSQAPKGDRFDFAKTEELIANFTLFIFFNL